MTLGENLQNLRKEAGLSQEQVAQTLFVTRQTISKWENDQAEPGVKDLKALARLYGVSIDALVGGLEEGRQGEELFQWAVVLRICTLICGMLFIDGGVMLYSWDLPLLFAGCRWKSPLLWGAAALLEGSVLFVFLIGTAKVFWFWDAWSPFPWLLLSVGIASSLALLLNRRTRMYFRRERAEGIGGRTT